MFVIRLKTILANRILGRILLTIGLWSTPVVFVFDIASAQQDQVKKVPEMEIRSDIQRAVKPIESAMVGYRENRRCFSCHHHAHAIVALSEMSRRGVSVNRELLQMQFLRTVGQTMGVDQRYENHQNIGGGVDTTGYALLAMKTGGHPPDKLTKSMLAWILKKNPEQGFWTGTKNRAPTQTSDITRTWLCLTALNHFGSADLLEQIDERNKKSKEWLLDDEAHSTEDKVSRIRALSVLEDADKEIAKFANELLEEQNADGGWAQSNDMQSDAYATGSVLMTLHQQAGLATERDFYRRGVRFLLSSQLDDGTWHVKTRATPVQKYFESGFPHGRDQYISITATCWAATALSLTLPVMETTNQTWSTASEMQGDLQQRLQRRFNAEIWPLISENGKSSCTRCHHQRHRSGLRLTGEPETDFSILLRQGFLHPSDPSSILESIASKEADRKMPPGKLPQWTDDQIETLKRFTQALQPVKSK